QKMLQRKGKSGSRGITTRQTGYSQALGGSESADCAEEEIPRTRTATAYFPNDSTEKIMKFFKVEN
ncbi:hypothetical protein J6590_052725, partial [Homalodisca vitripennis]